ncbi:MAG: hypothetical protein R6V18_07115 [Desulfuromonadaceae bacterium]
MRIFKNLKTATMVSILLTSFMFLSQGVGISEADGYARHFRSAGNHGYQNNAVRHQDRQITQRVITTTRYSTPRGSAQLYGNKSCRSNTSRHRGNNRHLGRNRFKHHQNFRQSNFQHQRRAQQHARHSLGLFAALPGIIVNIPL